MRSHMPEIMAESSASRACSILSGVERVQPDSSPYTLHPVSVPGFSGPLDLLLLLIEEGKLDISAISLASVTDQYLVRLRSLSERPPEHLAEFLLVAATLLLLKSRKLFPELPLSEEEEISIASLEEQLREYRKFRDAARTLLQRWNQGPVSYARESFLGLTVTFYPPPNIDLSSLRAALDSVLQQLPRLDVRSPDVLRRVVSIEERVRDIQQRLTEHARITFEHVRSSAASKLDVIVSFLALLELVKRRLVAVEQPGAFHDILLTRPTKQAE